MARNLVKEKEEDQVNNIKQELNQAAEQQPQKEVTIITIEEAILINLSIIISRLNEMDSRILKGFKDVGVKFD